MGGSLGQPPSRAQPANRREKNCYPEIPDEQSRSCDKRRIVAAVSGGFRSAERERVIICPVEILLTGASGFVGSLLLPRLTSDGHSVRALSRNPELLSETLLELPDETARTTVVAGDAITGQGL
jgi:hypothetical protein